MSKNNVFQDTVFNRFFLDLASANKAKIDGFSNILGKRRFCKNRAPVEARARFLRFGPSKNRGEIDTKTHSKITSKKGGPNIDFYVHVGLRKPLKSIPKATSNGACFATLCKLPTSRRKATGGIVCKASKRLGI